MNFDGLGNNTGDLNIDKDMYRLRIKTTLAIIQKMNFEDFLKKHIEVGPGISPGELFQNGVWDCLLAVEHAIKKNDNELLEYINTLIEKLKNEQGDEENIPLGKIFAKLLAKAKNVCQAGLHISGIIATFEFKRFLEEFKEKIAKKMTTADTRNNVASYSNN
mgnify:FL=1